MPPVSSALYVASLSGVSSAFLNSDFHGLTPKNCYVTFAANGLAGGGPSAYLWNADGSVYSGTTVTLHVLGLSQQSY